MSAVDLETARKVHGDACSECHGHGSRRTCPNDRDANPGCVDDWMVDELAADVPELAGLVLAMAGELERLRAEVSRLESERR